MTIHEALRARIRELRLQLQGSPEGIEAARVLRRLYALQRLDREDVLGERGATVGFLVQLRTRLGEPSLPGAVRTVAEAALIAEMDEAIRAGDYAGATALVAGAAGRVEGADALRRLRLVEVSLDEQAGRYESALARLATLIAAVPETEAGLRRDLQARAAVVAERGGLTAGAAAAPLASASGMEGPPAVLALRPPYPNPTSRGATVPLDLPTGSRVRAEVFDILGRRVATLVDGEMEAGRHLLHVVGSGLASGAYIVRAEVGTGGAMRVLTQRLTLIR
jgi:hypothetical protein